jgi:hypothetical protein
MIAHVLLPFFIFTYKFLNLGDVGVEVPSFVFQNTETYVYMIS